MFVMFDQIQLIDSACRAYLESTEHRTQAFKHLTRNDAQVRMHALHML